MAIKKENLMGIIKVDLVLVTLLTILDLCFNNKIFVILTLIFNVVLLGSYLIIDKNLVLIESLSQSKKFLGGLYNMVGENNG